MAAEWFCRIGEEELGPLSAQRLRAMADEGRLTAADHVRQGRAGAWVPAGRVKGLFPQAGPSTGTPPGTPQKDAVPKAKPLDDVDQKPLPKAKPVAARPATAAEVPVARPVTGPKIPRAEPSAVPPAPPRPPQAAGPGGGPLGIVTDTVAARARPTAGTGAGSEFRRKRGSNLVVVAVLAVMAVGLGIALTILAVAGNPLADSDQAAGNGDVPPGSARHGDLSGNQPPARPEKIKWIDASKSSVQRGGVRVKIASAELGYADIAADSTPADPPRQCLLITVQLHNVDPTQGLQIKSFNGHASLGRGVKLTDDAGRTCPFQDLGPGTLSFTGRVTEDRLAFRRPAAGAKHLKLKLPAAAFGSTGSVYFKIPATMILDASQRTEPLPPPTAGNRAAGPDDPTGEPTPDVSEIERGIRELREQEKEKPPGDDAVEKAVGPVKDPRAVP